MRCQDLPGTWIELRDWFAGAQVLVLPRLEFTGPSARLDADVDRTRAATPAELAMVLGRLRALVTHLGARVAYVGHVDDRPLDGDEPGRGGPAAPAAVTIRVVAGGVVHELALVAAWYAALSDGPATYACRAA